jgi:hypothetical protein
MSSYFEYYSSPRRRRQLFWLFLFVFWYAYFFENMLLSQSRLDSSGTILYYLLSISIPILLSLFLRFLYLRYRCYSFSPGNLVVVILLYSTFCALIWTYGNRLLGYLIWGEQSGPLHYFTPKILFTWTWFNAHPFVIWSSFYLGFKIYEEWMLQKQSTERAQMLAQTAQLETLRYQLNPHFLFNALSSLAIHPLGRKG